MEGLHEPITTVAAGQGPGGKPPPSSKAAGGLIALAAAEVQASGSTNASGAVRTRLFKAEPPSPIHVIAVHGVAELEGLRFSLSEGQWLYHWNNPKY